MKYCITEKKDYIAKAVLKMMKQGYMRGGRVLPIGNGFYVQMMKAKEGVSPRLDRGL